MTRSRFTGAALAFYLILAALALLWLQGRGSGPTITRAAEWPTDLGVGVGVGLAMVGLWNLGRRVLPRMQELEDKLQELIGPLDRVEILLVAGVSGLVEELFFRGAMLPSWGLVLSTLVFGLLHTGPGPAFRAWTVFALVAGGVFGGLVLWRESLLAAIVAHATVNAIQLNRLLPRPGEDREPPIPEVH